MEANPLGGAKLANDKTGLIPTQRASEANASRQLVANMCGSMRILAFHGDADLFASPTLCVALFCTPWRSLGPAQKSNKKGFQHVPTTKTLYS
eukprot:6141588-Amphidinium_carterae.1